MAEESQDQPETRQGWRIGREVRALARGEPAASLTNRIQRGILVKHFGYKFFSYNHPSSDWGWLGLPGVFIFCGKSPDGKWKAYHVGQTTSLYQATRPSKEWDKAKTMGATHIHGACVNSQKTRNFILRKLQARLSSPIPYKSHPDKNRDL
jgi:hypothetical protein